MRKLENWIDFMENECSPKEEAQLKMLLNFSKGDQLILDNLRRLRNLIKLCDKADAIEGLLSEEKFLQKSHKAIMDRIARASKSADPNNVLSLERDRSIVPATYKR